MFCRQLWCALLFAGLSSIMSADFASAQLFVPSPGDRFDVGLTSLSALQSAKLDSTIFQFNTPHTSRLELQDGSVSRLDRKVPGEARREFERGYLQLLGKNFQAAIDHLARATSIYPSFVAAHRALGIAYLNSGQTQKAHDEFVLAVELDGYLPGSYLNLGCAQLLLQQYPEAEESLKKASSMAPLDLEVLEALAYTEYKNRDYPAVIATARHVHSGAHQGAALVHLFAAGAWEAKRDPGEAQEEMETLLGEEPTSPLSAQFRQILDQLKAEQASPAQAKKRLPADPRHSESGDPRPASAPKASSQIQRATHDMTENSLLAVRANADTSCTDCRTTSFAEPAEASGPSSGSEQPDANIAHQVIRIRVEEVALYFSATDHGKSVTGLRLSDIQIRDDNQPPEAILGFHDVTQLPLRIALVIDMSNSVTDRFSFEQGAASKFLATVTDESDLALVVGFNCSVILAQDFTSDQILATRAITQLAPGGGTALWDAVAFAADKLASHPETQPVARVLVVISDGDDNSSSVPLQQAIWTAQRGEVAIYSVSTSEGSSASLGNHALKTLSEQTGGAAFTPGSLGGLTRSLADLQQVLRGRYLIYYKPASPQPDGRFHAVDIKAEKDGRKLKIFARKGYYASALLDAGI
jgi:Ca-activated chloride channel family protein